MSCFDLNPNNPIELALLELYEDPEYQKLTLPKRRLREQILLETLNSEIYEKYE
jgi:hypothetical protein